MSRSTDAPPKPPSATPRPWPRRAYFEVEALDHPEGAALRQRLQERGCPVTLMPPGHRTPRLGRVTDPAAAYFAAKEALIANVHRAPSFQTCRPSADYQLPLVTSCPGRCAYCYLQTTLGARPWVRAWVNTAEILAQADAYTAGAVAVTFEASATGDPIPLETLTGSLSAAITWAGAHPRALVRVTTKFAGIEPLLGLEHRGRTRVRFSVNPGELVARWEPETSPLAERLAAVARLAAAGYPVGFMVAPIFATPGWRGQYAELFSLLSTVLRGDAPRGADGDGLTVEAVTHRYTPRARDLIEARHAGAGLPLDEAGRTWRMGQFGYGKYTYDRQTMAELRAGLAELTARHLPEARLVYVV